MARPSPQNSGYRREARFSTWAAARACWPGTWQPLQAARSLCSTAIRSRWRWFHPLVLAAERHSACFAAKLAYAYERMIGEPVLAPTPESLAEMFSEAEIEGRSWMGAGDSYGLVGVRK